MAAKSNHPSKAGSCRREKQQLLDLAVSSWTSSLNDRAWQLQLRSESRGSQDQAAVTPRTARSCWWAADRGAAHILAMLMLLQTRKESCTHGSKRWTSTKISCYLEACRAILHASMRTEKPLAKQKHNNFLSSWNTSLRKMRYVHSTKWFVVRSEN